MSNNKGGKRGEMENTLHTRTYVQSATGTFDLRLCVIDPPPGRYTSIAMKPALTDVAVTPHVTDALISQKIPLSLGFQSRRGEKQLGRALAAETRSKCYSCSSKNNVLLTLKCPLLPHL